MILDDTIEIVEDNTDFTKTNTIIKDNTAWQDIGWSSAEKITSKNFTWYLSLIVITLIFGVAIYLLTKDIISSAVIVLCGVILFIYSFKKPTPIDYQLRDSSIFISNKEFKIGSFKSFSIIRHGSDTAIALVPMKRFYPYLYINLTSTVSADVIERLSSLIPIEKPKSDLLEAFMRFIKF